MDYKYNTKVILYNLNTEELNHKEGKIIDYTIDNDEEFRELMREEGIMV